MLIVVVFLQNVEKVNLLRNVHVVHGMNVVVGQQFIIPNRMEDILCVFYTGLYKILIMYYECFENISLAAFSISSGVTSFLCVAIAQRCPYGS